jgi:predicted DNA-binding protein YlxM (UPF0122 family)
MFMFFYFKWYVKRRTSASGLLPEYRTEVYKLIAEIDAATDRDSQLVEDRIKKLKEILDDTDKRISVYVKELEKSRTGEALYTSLGRGIRAALKTETEPVVRSDNALPLSAVRPNIVPVAQHSTLPETAPAIMQQSGDSLSQKPPSKRQIRALIDLLVNEDIPPQEIASRLNISIAEVDLAMNLRKKNSP